MYVQTNAWNSMECQVSGQARDTGQAALLLSERNVGWSLVLALLKAKKSACLVSLWQYFWGLGYFISLYANFQQTVVLLCILKQIFWTIGKVSGIAEDLKCQCITKQIGYKYILHHQLATPPPSHLLSNKTHNKTKKKREETVFK